MEQTQDAGLGDTFQRIADAVGATFVTKQVEKITGKDCGCAKRQAWLNEKVPYRRTMVDPPEDGQGSWG